MVLGATQQLPTCHYCGKPGHFKRDCFKYRNDLASGKVQPQRGGTARGGRSRGGGMRGGMSRHNATYSSLNSMATTDSVDLDEVYRLGMAAFENK